MRRILFVAPLVIFGVLAGYFAVQLGEDPSIVPSALIDRPMPGIDTPPLLSDKPGVKTEELLGKVSILNVWASWCIPCRAEHPLINQLAQRDGITVHGLNYKDKRADAVAWLDELGDPYARIGFDESGRAGIDLGVYGVPETYIIGPDGHIRYKRVGPITPQILEDDILPLIRDLKS